MRADMQMGEVVKLLRFLGKENKTVNPLIFTWVSGRRGYLRIELISNKDEMASIMAADVNFGRLPQMVV